MRKHHMKKIMLGSLGAILILSLLFQPVMAMTGNDFDLMTTITSLFTRVNSQDEKIAVLENKIEELKDLLDAKKNPPEIIPKEEPRDTVIETDPPKEEEKVEEEKPVDPKPDPELTLKLTIKTGDAGLKLTWTKETDENLRGVKIVISESNPKPSYPDDGYLAWITDPNVTSLLIDGSETYNGGDIDGSLKSDTTYYFTVTYVYEDKKITTSTVTYKTPSFLTQDDEELPVDPESLALTIITLDDSLQLSWTPEPSKSLLGYKVVISESNPNPSYPNDGYLKWITDRAQTSLTIDNAESYNGGDINGTLKGDTIYYFTITYVYADEKVTTSTVTFKTPSSFSQDEEEQPIDPESLELIYKIWDNTVQLSWTPEPSKSLLGYKVVISESNPNPSYPDDGYLRWITNWEENSIIIDNSESYNGGDINSYLKPNTNYYLAITYIYQDHKVTTDPIVVLTPATLHTNR